MKPEPPKPYNPNADDLAALKVIVEALTPFSGEDRMRILDSVLVFYGLDERQK